MAAESLWLHTRRYDTAWYVGVPIALYVVMVGASHAIGPNGPVTVYMLSALLTGLPHNMITWLLLLPAANRRHYEPGVVFGPFVLTALVMVPTILSFGTPWYAWALSLNIVIAFYHITRQHQGMLHVADGRYIQATGQAGITAVSRWFRWFLGGFAAAGLAWKMAGPPLLLGLYGQPVAFSIQHLPLAVPIFLTALTLYALARCAASLIAHRRAGHPWPQLHLALGLPAFANLAAACLVPNEQFFLSLALIASYHNLQYFAFCYTHHHLRATSDEQAQDPYSRWARARRWGPWFALPLGLGVAYGLSTLAMTPFWASVAATWFMTSHYFVDGHMWRRKYYPLMGRFGKGRVGISGAVAPAEA